MSQVTVRQFLITAIILTGFMGGIFVYISNFVPGDSDFTRYNQTVQKFTEMKTQSDTLTDQIKDAQPSSGVLGILNGLIESSWSALKLVWGSMTIMGTLLTDISDTFGVPYWFTSMIIAVLTLGVVFSLMAAWFKWVI